MPELSFFVVEVAAAPADVVVEAAFPLAELELELELPVALLLLLVLVLDLVVVFPALPLDTLVTLVFPPPPTGSAPVAVSVTDALDATPLTFGIAV